jgi:hypothetical protein
MMMPPVVAVSEANTPPGYPWFQQLEASRNELTNITEMNHLATQNEASRQRISYGDQDRTDKVGFANREAIERNGLADRDAIERNGLANLTATERNFGENRVTTLTSAAETRAQNSANFTQAQLGQKDILIGLAANGGLTREAALTESLRGQKTALVQGSMNRDAVGAVSLQSAVQAGDLKNQNSWQHGRLHETQERGFAALGLQASHIRNEQEKAFALLGLQAANIHADTDRRMANYRADTDRRVADGFTAAALFAAGAKVDQERGFAAIALQAANNKAELSLQAVTNTAALSSQIAECCCKVEQLVNTTSATTQQLVQSLDGNRVRDALASSQQEALILRVSRRRSRSRSRSPRR